MKIRKRALNLILFLLISVNFSPFKKKTGKRANSKVFKDLWQLLCPSTGKHHVVSLGAYKPFTDKELSFG